MEEVSIAVIKADELGRKLRPELGETKSRTEMKIHHTKGMNK